MDKELLKELARKHPEIILPPYDAVMAAPDGFEAICLIAEHLGGHNTYVPSLRTIFSRCLEAGARQEYGGTRHKSIAHLSRKYGYTERHLRRLLEGQGRAPGA